MATDLYVISNITTTKEKVIANKDLYLKQLKALQLEPTSYIRIIDNKETWLESKGDWEYEFPTVYDDNTDSIIPDTETKEIIYYSSPFVFSVTVYENCLELSTIYKYSFLYEDEKTDYINEFRKNIYDIISIFGGTEIIYLADNGCDKLGMYLELQVWEGVSYFEIKKDMTSKGLPFVSDYYNLKLNNLNYRNIKEIIFDDFSNLK
jgi:hypothetical protein